MAILSGMAGQGGQAGQGSEGAYSSLDGKAVCNLNLKFFEKFDKI